MQKKIYGQFQCLGENTEKYITFSVPINEELNIGKTITYKLKFIYSFRFISTSFSSLADNLSEKLHSDKCRDCKSELNYMSLEYNHLIFQIFECKRNYMKYFNKDMINRFVKPYKFCKGNISKFVLLLKKEFILMNTWTAGKDLQQIKFRRC